MIFSSTEHGCEFERHVGDGEQSGKPQGIIWGQGIRAAFDVQDARMSRVHGCTRATLGTSFLDKQKRSTSPLKAKPILNKSNSSYFILDSRFHGNDGGLPGRSLISISPRH